MLWSRGSSTLKTSWLSIARPLVYVRTNSSASPLEKPKLARQSLGFHNQHASPDHGITVCNQHGDNSYPAHGASFAPADYHTQVEGRCVGVLPYPPRWGTSGLSLSSTLHLLAVVSDTEHFQGKVVLRYLDGMDEPLINSIQVILRATMGGRSVAAAECHPAIVVSRSGLSIP